MPRILPREFEQLDLRIHTFLDGVPLHDVWAIDLPWRRPGVTLDRFLGAAGPLVCTLSPLARTLLQLRFLIGKVFNWDREEATRTSETFAARLTDADRSRSLVPAGTPDGYFRVVYRFENEQLLELINRTAHAAAVTALVETSRAYRLYFAVYVRKASRFTAVWR